MNIIIFLLVVIDTIAFGYKAQKSKKFRDFFWRFLPFSWLFFKNDLTEDQKITKEIMKHYK